MGAEVVVQVVVEAAAEEVAEEVAEVEAEVVEALAQRYHYFSPTVICQRTNHGRGKFPRP